MRLLSFSLDDALNITATEDTPGIAFEKTTGQLSISGKSLPEDAVAFYMPLITWLSHYAKSPNKETQVVFNLVYFNTSSAKQIFKIFTLLKDLSQNNLVKIIWRYDKGDKDMMASGERFSKLAQIPIEATQN